MNIKKDIILRVRIMFLGILLFAGGIIYRVVRLQTYEGEHWRKKSKESYVRERVVDAVRGNIYADDGSLLATSLPKYRLGFDPMVAGKTPYNQKVYTNGIDSLCHLLANFYQDKDWKDYKSMMNSARAGGMKYIRLNDIKIDFQQLKAMRTWPIFREGRFKGGVFFEGNRKSRD
jgi:cell division protein FtsI (penicillin-binding protein 3)